MVKGLLYLLPFFLASLVFGKDKPENWLQVNTPHFVVISNASEKESRHIAGQFERMRLVFQTALPQMQIDPPSPIIVIAVKNGKDFQQLEPIDYLGKGKLQLAGLFLRVPDKNYILLRLDIAGDHPYASVYHEYTHLLTSKADAWMPLWLTEGLAEFFQNTDIQGKEVLLGEPSLENISLLQRNSLLPLAMLFSIDYASPYYHEENKGSIFYAESWALTHFLEVTDFQKNTHRLQDYENLVSKGTSTNAAAKQAFGNLEQLQNDLESYIRTDSDRYFFKFAQPIYIDETTFKVHSITQAEADAHRADLLAHNNRTADSRNLLDAVLREDPNNTLAHETMGYLEFREGHLDEALKWYREAVKLDSKSYLANYYFAAISMDKDEMDSTQESEVEKSLRNSIKLNPSFAPSYDDLAIFYKMKDRNLEEAHRLELQAVELDPTNLNYRMNTAYILVAMQQYPNAVNVIKMALKFAKTPSELAQAQLFLDQIQIIQGEIEHRKELQKQMEQSTGASLEVNSGKGGAADDMSNWRPPALSREPKIVLRGPHHFVTGIIKKVRCSEPAIMDFKLDTGKQVLDFHSANYYHIQFTALNFTPQEDLKPCIQLAGVRGKVEFVTDNKKQGKNYAISIELQY